MKVWSVAIVKVSSVAIVKVSSVARVMMSVAGALLLYAPAMLVAQQPVPTPPAATAATATGRIAGRVVEQASGQPIAGAQILIGNPLVAQSENRPLAVTDMDGRYRSTPLPVGAYRVVARRLGTQPKQYDGIAVTANQTTLVNFALTNSAVQLNAVVVSAERSDRATSEAGLLAMQKGAAAASDGVSAEQIKRTPDADAGQAAARVSGVSVVDNKFVVVRGLSERYSNTLLNGVEVTSPEPSKKIVPLDIFPASLLEAIVVSKSATPDKPGDFAGGSVEIRTKEFPEQRVLQYGMSLGWNSQTTGKLVQVPQWSGMDYLGFDDGRRSRPAFPNNLTDRTRVERFSEGLRNTWNPPLVHARPNVGASLSLGDQKQWAKNALGYVASLTYGLRTENQPQRFFQFLLDPTTIARGYVYDERRQTVDWGGVFNASYKLGGHSKFGFKNLYTRNAEEQYVTNEGFNIDLNGDFRGFQYSYITRDLLQSQLTGEHIGKLILPWRFEWKGTVSRSARDEPDNRQVPYIRPDNDSTFFLGTNSVLWFRELKDRLRSGQGDLSIPLPWWGGRNAQFKTGSMARSKVREFKADAASFNLSQSATLPNDIATLRPERLFAPENVGQYMEISFISGIAQPYSADDKLFAGYGMLDVAVFSWLRLVGGVRVENWQLDLFDGGRGLAERDSTIRPTVRRNKDLLWSGNGTISLGDRMNLRMAAFRSVARPDTRELSHDEYVDIVGNCPTIGNSQLQRSLITNADLRWEWYPGPGEVIAVSGFYKYFDTPVIRVVTGDNNCRFTYNNGTDATIFGSELDFRKGLAFLPGPLTNLSLGLNASYVRSRLRIDPRFGVYDKELPLEDQSPYLLNASLGYVESRHGLDASVLYNWFDDRVSRYGFRSGGGGQAKQGPNIVEKGRGTLDAKLQWKVWKTYTATLGARNLTNVAWEFYQDAAAGRVSTGYFKPGRTITLGMAYAR